MLIDFLRTCHTLFPDEAADFDALCRELDTESAFVGFMPSIYPDLWPVHALHTTGAVRFTGSTSQPKIYVIPIGASDLAAYPMIRKMITEFYSDATSAETLAVFEKFGAEWEETILLSCPRKNHAVAALGINSQTFANTVYFRVTMQNGSQAHLFFVCDTPDGAWRNMIEAYSIPVNMLIHSHKGIGDWYTSTPLFKVMQKTVRSTLLPKYYFRDSYISRDDTPEGSEGLEDIPEGDSGRYSTIYKLPAIL